MLKILSIITIQPVVITNIFDKNLYKWIISANEITTFLISNLETKTSGCAITFGFGSSDDPPEYPGLAHFLEHMLFMGTNK
jgi:secreted Zn-dependent insulinase-like peptidase